MSYDANKAIEERLSYADPYRHDDDEYAVACCTIVEVLKANRVTEDVERCLRAAIRYAVWQHRRTARKHAGVPILPEVEPFTHDLDASAFADLSELDREYLDMRQRGWSNEEIARERGVSTRTVRRRFQRILNLIREK